MPDMFVKDVQQHQGDDNYTRAIEAMKRAGMEYPQILHMFSYKMKATVHLERFTQEILREPAPLSPGLVDSVLADVETSLLSDAEKALMRFVRKVNGESPAIGATDIEPLHAAGWTDEAICYAITVCALFKFYNRWIDASGVHPMSEEAHVLSISSRPKG